MTIKQIRENIKKHVVFEIRITLIFIGVGIIFGWMYLTVHEQVHAAILNSYGIASTTHVSLFTGSGSTQPLNQTEYNEKCTAECVLANNFTEVIGYHAALLIFCLMGLFYINRILEGEENREENKKQEQIDTIQNQNDARQDDEIAAIKQSIQ